MLVAWARHDPGMDARLTAIEATGRLTVEVVIHTCETAREFKEGYACKEEDQAKKANGWATFITRGALLGMTVANNNTMSVRGGGCCVFGTLAHLPGRRRPFPLSAVTSPMDPALACLTHSPPQSTYPRLQLKVAYKGAGVMPLVPATTPLGATPAICNLYHYAFKSSELYSRVRALPQGCHGLDLVPAVSGVSGHAIRRASRGVCSPR